jgi:hypothetical protein
LNADERLYFVKGTNTINGDSSDIYFLAGWKFETGHKVFLKMQDTVVLKGNGKPVDVYGIIGNPDVTSNSWQDPTLFGGGNLATGSSRGCDQLYGISTNDNMSFLPVRCFSNCKNLTSVHLGKNMRELDAGGSTNTPFESLIFAYCPKLDPLQISVAPTNQFLKLKKSRVNNKPGAVVLATYRLRGNGGIVTKPYGTTLAAGGILACEIFNDLDVPGGISGVFSNLKGHYIPNRAFDSCYSITDVDLRNINWVGDRAFLGTNNLKSVYIYQKNVIFTKYYDDQGNIISTPNKEQGNKAYKTIDEVKVFPSADENIGFSVPITNPGEYVYEYSGTFSHLYVDNGEKTKSSNIVQIYLPSDVDDGTLDSYQEYMGHVSDVGFGGNNGNGNAAKKGKVLGTSLPPVKVPKSLEIKLNGPGDWEVLGGEELDMWYATVTNYEGKDQGVTTIKPNNNFKWTISVAYVAGGKAGDKYLKVNGADGFELEKKNVVPFSIRQDSGIIDVAQDIPRSTEWDVKITAEDSFGAKDQATGEVIGDFMHIKFTVSADEYFYLNGYSRIDIDKSDQGFYNYVFGVYEDNVKKFESYDAELMLFNSDGSAPKGDTSKLTDEPLESLLDKYNGANNKDKIDDLTYAHHQLPGSFSLTNKDSDGVTNKTKISKHGGENLDNFTLKIDPNTPSGKYRVVIKLTTNFASGDPRVLYKVIYINVIGPEVKIKDNAGNEITDSDKATVFEGHKVTKTYLATVESPFDGYEQPLPTINSWTLSLVNGDAKYASGGDWAKLNSNGATASVEFNFPQGETKPNGNRYALTAKTTDGDSKTIYIDVEYKTFDGIKIVDPIKDVDVENASAVEYNFYSIASASTNSFVIDGIGKDSGITFDKIDMKPHIQYSTNTDTTSGGFSEVTNADIKALFKFENNKINWTSSTAHNCLNEGTYKITLYANLSAGSSSKEITKDVFIHIRHPILNILGNKDIKVSKYVTEHDYSITFSAPNSPTGVKMDATLPTGGDFTVNVIDANSKFEIQNVNNTGNFKLKFNNSSQEDIQSDTEFKFNIEAKYANQTDITNTLPITAKYLDNAAVLEDVTNDDTDTTSNVTKFQLKTVERQYFSANMKFNVPTLNGAGEREAKITDIKLNDKDLSGLVNVTAGPVSKSSGTEPINNKFNVNVKSNFDTSTNILPAGEYNLEFGIEFTIDIDGSSTSVTTLVSYKIIIEGVNGNIENLSSNKSTVFAAGDERTYTLRANSDVLGKYGITDDDIDWAFVNPKCTLANSNGTTITDLNPASSQDKAVCFKNSTDFEMSFELKKKENSNECELVVKCNKISDTYEVKLSSVGAFIKTEYAPGSEYGHELSTKDFEFTAKSAINVNSDDINYDWYEGNMGYVFDINSLINSNGGNITDFKNLVETATIKEYGSQVNKQLIIQSDGKVYINEFLSQGHRQFVLTIKIKDGPEYNINLNINVKTPEIAIKAPEKEIEINSNYDYIQIKYDHIVPPGYNGNVKFEIVDPNIKGIEFSQDGTLTINTSYFKTNTTVKVPIKASTAHGSVVAEDYITIHVNKMETVNYGVLGTICGAGAITALVAGSVAIHKHSINKKRKL